MDASLLTPADRLALALAWVLASQLPMWALVLWVARSSAAWRVAADRVWVRVLAGTYAPAALVLSSWGSSVALLRGSLTDQRIVLGVGLAQLGLLAMAVEWVKRRRGGGRWSKVTRFAAQLATHVDANPAAPYAGWKTRVAGVREELGSTAIALRPYGIWDSIAFPLGMLVGMGVAASVLSEPGTDPQRRAIGGLILLATGLGFGLVGALVAHLLVGREELLTVSGGTLTIDRELLRWPKVRRRRAFAAGEVLNLRAVEPPPRKTSDRYVRPMPAPWLLNLEFDHEGGTVRFGAGLAGPDADVVLRALARAMSAATPA